ncbi:RNA polymerase III subunit RPC82 helix-turn-helix domain-containing protein [Polychytrium aggregatum]|uniref:RNA polymerase III subunit RPC82 helix-turn-helix domain-containing protein n=1 Tax=Polychytrium aggregatum TaxID=110093 RepID=UPI0022FE7B7F|nr:RNA polymerase III subunit RPC82 helix-turn-helix domain-containing protein [Polychytrium aggregatum]KAI9209760.1 RNA polymerase III subunit RPC82 helix-turn-helix domain-containing protein [Polychytrium aggregatum]
MPCSVVSRLCLTIIREHFGPVVEKVAAALLTRGRLTLANLVQISKQSAKNVRESLFILIQHNIVMFTEQAEGLRIMVFYSIDELQIMFRDRYSLYVSKIAEEYGHQGRDLALCIIKQGKSNYPTILKDLDARDEATQNEIRYVLTRLIADRFLVAVEVSDAKSIIDKNIEREKAAIAEMGGAPLTSSELKKLRKKLFETPSYDATVSTGSKRKVLDFDEVSRKKVAMEDSKIEYSDDQFWKINVEYCNIHCRTDIIAKLATMRISSGAGHLIRVILRKLQDKMKTCRGEKTSEDISQLWISQALRDDSMLKIEGEDSDNRLASYLDVLAEDPAGFLTKIDERGGGTYVVALERLKGYLQTLAIESMIYERYGSVFCRIWRLLKIEGYLDEKQVSRLAMIPIKTARECLNELMAGGFVFIQDVPKTTDHAPSRTFYLFGVSVDQCVERMLQQSYRMLNNVKLRRKKELEDRQVLLEKIERTDVAQNLDLLSDSDKAQWGLLKKTVGLLKATELRLDELIMTLRDI